MRSRGCLPDEARWSRKAGGYQLTHVGALTAGFLGIPKSKLDISETYLLAMVFVDMSTPSQSGFSASLQPGRVDHSTPGIVSRLDGVLERPRSVHRVGGVPAVLLGR
jgi:hypothetical protein